MSRKIKVPSMNKGFGWVGQWSDGGIGWNCPKFVTYFSNSEPALGFVKHPYDKKGHSRYFLCRIIIEPVVDKKGRPITRKGKKDA